MSQARPLPAAERLGVDLRRADDRFLTRTGWAETRHSFSFGDHYDPGNVAFGPLLVHNEDRLRVGEGYGDHPHRDAEIVTWTLSGSLVHEDSRGNRGIVYPGLAQRVSAGSGILHAERNDAFRSDPAWAGEPAHFVQMWLLPDEPGVEPSYQQREVDRAALQTGWVPVASGQHPDAAIRVGRHAATLWVTRLAPGEARDLPEGLLVHAYVARGAVQVEGVGALGAGDALRITGPHELGVVGVAEAELLCWEMGR